MQHHRNPGTEGCGWPCLPLSPVTQIPGAPAVRRRPQAHAGTERSQALSLQPFRHRRAVGVVADGHTAPVEQGRPAGACAADPRGRDVWAGCKGLRAERMLGLELAAAMAGTCSAPSEPVCSLPDPGMRCSGANTRVPLLSPAGICAQTEPSIRLAGCPQGTLAPGAPSPDKQKVKYEFHPSRHFNDFTWEPKERRETERSRSSCLVTTGERRRGWGRREFLSFFSHETVFLHFQETQIPLPASPVPYPAWTSLSAMSSGCFCPCPQGCGKVPVNPEDSAFPAHTSKGPSW